MPSGGFYSAVLSGGKYCLTFKHENTGIMEKEWAKCTLSIKYLVAHKLPPTSNSKRTVGRKGVVLTKTNCKSRMLNNKIRQCRQEQSVENRSQDSSNEYRFIQELHGNVALSKKYYIYRITSYSSRQVCSLLQPIIST